MKLVAGATVKGKVVKDGKPMAGITLMLCSGRDQPRPFVTGFSEKIATDPEGFFQFTNVPPDREYHVFGLMDSCHSHGVIDARPVRVGAGSTERTWET